MPRVNCDKNFEQISGYSLAVIFLREMCFGAQSSIISWQRTLRGRTSQSLLPTDNGALSSEMRLTKKDPGK